MDRPLRVAIIGAGLIGRWHANYAEKAGAHIVSIVDKDVPAAHRLAAHHRSAKAYEDLSSCLAGMVPDAAHVCTPSETHAQIAARLLERGVHVLAEKPVANDTEETTRILRIADEHRALFCPVYQFPFQRGFRKARDELAAMGDAIRVEITICSAGAARLAGGADALVREILPHPISIMSMLWSDARADLGSWSATVSEGELFALGRFGTLHASVCISAHARPPRCEARILCRSGAFFLDFFHGFVAIERGGVGRRAKIAQPFTNAGSHALAALGNLLHRARVREPAYPGLRNLIREFYWAIRHRDGSPIAPEIVIAVAQWCDRIQSWMPQPTTRVG